MAKYDFDLFVIGGGSGGVRAARIAASHGARVAIAEQSRYGGTCVIRGCIPKKLLVYASEFSHHFADAKGFGWQVGEAAFSWPELIAAKDREIARLEGIYRATLSRAGATVLDGRSVLEDAHTVSLNGRHSSAETILLATGGTPTKPNVPGAAHCIVSDDAFDLPALPGRVAILGGGFIACEFAGIFNGLGTDVTVIHRGDSLLRGFDDDVAKHLAGEMRKRGVKFVMGGVLAGIARAGTGVAVALQDGRKVAADQVLAATGRHPNTGGMGLEQAGVRLTPDGAVIVDEWSRTSVANIYAVGDLTDRIKLTPVAIMEGHAFADTLYGKRPRQADHENVPHAVFSQPNVGAVGLTEAAARARRGRVVVYRSVFTPLKHTLTGATDKTLMKLVVDGDSDRVLGCHMVGPDAGEIIQGLAIAIKCKARKADFDATVGIHPTAAEEFVTMRTPVPDAPTA
jgi:glutathione reductase (NADPH)